MIDLSSIIRLAQAPGVPPAAKCVVFDGHSAMSVAHASGSAVWWAGVPFEQSGLAQAVPVPVETLKAHRLRSRHVLVSATHLHNGADLRTEWPAEHACSGAAARLPAMPASEPVARCQVVLDELDRVAIAASVHDIRSYLQGVALDFEVGAMVATNGHRLHCQRGGVPKVPGAGVVILPVAAVKWLLHSKDDVAQVTVWRDAAGVARALLHASDAFVFAVGLEGTFPDWRRVMPAPEACGALFAANPSAMASAVESMGKLHRLEGKEKTGLVVLDAAAGRIYAGEGPHFQAVDMPLDPGTSGAVPLAFQADYLQDAADCVGTGARWLLPRLQGRCAPGPLLVVDGRFSAVVMPMKALPANGAAAESDATEPEPEPCPAAVASVADQLMGRLKAGTQAPKKARRAAPEPVEA